MHALALTFFVTLAAPPATPVTAPAGAHAAGKVVDKAAEKVADKVGDKVADKAVDKVEARVDAKHAGGMTAVSEKTYADLVLAPHKGKVVVVNFWASYCLPCLLEIPALQELAKENAKNVAVVFVSSDPPSQAPHALALLKRRKVELTSFIVDNEDPEPFIQMINASSKDAGWGGEMPYTVIYDAQGAVIQKLPGAHSKADFQAAIDAAVVASNAKTAEGKKKP